VLRRGQHCLPRHDRHRGTGAAQRQALDQPHQLLRRPPHATVGSFWPGQPGQAAGAVADQPALRGAQRDLRLAGGLRERHPVLQVRPQDLPSSPGERLLLWPEPGQHSHSPVAGAVALPAGAGTSAPAR